MIFKKSLLATSILVATLGLTACGGSSSNDNNNNNNGQTPDQTTNAAPTAVTLKGKDADATEVTVTENMVAVEIGTLVVTDSDDDTHTISVSDERFEIKEGGILALRAGEHLNYELEQEVTVTVTVKDSENEKTFDVTFKVLDEMDYDFISRFEAGKSSVAYSGQIARHVLIKELFNYIKSDEFVTVSQKGKDAILTELNKIYAVSEENYESVWESRLLTVTTSEPTALQTTLYAISSSHKNLSGKVAGNDAKGQHKGTWSQAEDFAGWDVEVPEGNTTSVPELVVEQLFAMLAENAALVNSGGAAAPGGDEIDTVYVTPTGVDLNQMIQKFLYGALAFSQSADDYLDYGTEGKGLETDNTEAVDGKAYTNLEHQWDEGFGYFGAARNYMSYSDDEIAGKGGRDGFSAGYNDANVDGKIDFNSEYNFGNSTNAAKRDRGTAGNSKPTDLTKEAFEAFYNGRKLINSTEGALSDAQMETLKGHAKAALLAWEKAIAATVVHYINDTTKDLQALKAGVTGGEYTAADFATLAKHWSEMKGFALNFQFNRHSPFYAEGNVGQFEKMHDLMGNQPVIEPNDVDAYIEKLGQARDILQEVYGFDAENVANW
ncbi:DUF4856 domain-containing protein [Pseudoalteromonas sp. OOF1S-7]|uniref:DUF4856 domain-containing protein n=1 Tax=Pseudoalteromonas sp. OOF1S-7 TaxID=2917757 RepID=UPI001EF6EF6C|nr:DUF4856 domain-containing protein [Pseudoalteromonas sp. OOF1S-7]MCG7533706.1 DUF4856 domain-containing protein [Pseudoalteromonas sp. OOF1S-7]